MKPQLKYIERFPLLRLAWQLEQDWATELSQLLDVSKDELLDKGLTLPIDRLGTVKVELWDGSVVELNNAFYLVSEPKQVIVLFTEHCGHMLLPRHDSKVFVDGVLVYEANVT